MGYTLAEMRKAADMIAEKFNLKYDDAARVVGSFNGGPECGRVLAGNFTDAKVAYLALGITPEKRKPAGPRSDKGKTHKKRTQKNAASKTPAENIPASDQQKTPERIHTTMEERTPERVAGDIIGARPFDGVEPSTVADVIPSDFPAGVLPDDFQNRIRARLDDFQALNGFEDLSKIAGVQWRAACLFVGQYIKASGILHDRERERAHGGTVYDVGRVMALIDLWEYYTMSTKHIPLIGDGAAFCGISRDWLYDTKSDALTARRVNIAKKLERIEREALSSAVVDARENPTGRIWFEKSRLGYSEAPQVTISVTADLDKAAGLPVFNLPTLPG